MKKLNIYHIFRKNAGRFATVLLLSAFVGGLIVSCEQKDEFTIAMSGPLTVSATSGSMVLVQKDASKTALSFNWTSGTNYGTGASISYVFQLDKKGNGFSKPMTLKLGRQVYSKGFTVAALNDSLLKHWNISPNTQVQMEARVIDSIYSAPVRLDTSNVFPVTITPYQPVSKTLYLYGTASPNGTNANTAIALTPQQTDATVFVYQGSLNAGDLKFITTLGQVLPSYQKGADNSHILYRTDAAQPDDRLTVAQSAVYNVTVSLLDLTVSITKLDMPPYTTLYVVGSAAPNGWDIANATPLVESISNPFIFTYTGVLNAGEFKFPVNRNSDWGQDMFEMTDDTHMFIHKNGDGLDLKWTVAKKGYYTVTLNLLDNTISINRLQLYIVGNATSVGWTIGNAIQMTEDATNGCIFIYNGPMVAGDFKFPVNRNTDWGQDMYMKTDDTHMYHHIGGQSDDNKWTLTSAGNYIITANVETLSISIQKQ